MHLVSFGKSGVTSRHGIDKASETLIIGPFNLMQSNNK
jgi:hypothetical protein